MGTRAAITVLSAAFLAIGCSNDELTNPIEDFDVASVVSASGAAAKQLICHLDRETGQFKSLSVAVPALQAHLAHGDATPGALVPGFGTFVFSESCHPISMIDFETFPDGSPICSSCWITNQFAAGGLVLSPAMYVFDAAQYGPSSVLVNHALALSLFGVSPRTTMYFSHPPAIVTFEVASNNFAPSVVVAAKDILGGSLAVSRAATTYVTRYGFLFRREVITVAAGIGIGEIALDASPFPAYGYIVDNIAIEL